MKVDWDCDTVLYSSLALWFPCTILIRHVASARVFAADRFGNFDRVQEQSLANGGALLCESTLLTVLFIPHAYPTVQNLSRAQEIVWFSFRYARRLFLLVDSQLESSAVEDMSTQLAAYCHCCRVPWGGRTRLGQTRFA